MENPDLRKEAIDSLRGIKEELQGLFMLATDEKKSATCIGGNRSTVVVLLASAMVQDPEILKLFKEASVLAAVKMMAPSELN